MRHYVVISPNLTKLRGFLFDHGNINGEFAPAGDASGRIIRSSVPMINDLRRRPTRAEPAIRASLASPKHSELSARREATRLYRLRSQITASRRNLLRSLLISLSGSRRRYRPSLISTTGGRRARATRPVRFYRLPVRSPTDAGGFIPRG